MDEGQAAACLRLYDRDYSRRLRPGHAGKVNGMIEVTIQGVLLGLSTGLFCLGYCAPVYVPLMMSGNGRASWTARVVGELAAGRLAAYVIVGATAGYVGVQLEGTLLEIVTGASMIVLSVLLLLYAATQGWPHLSICRWVNQRRIRFPIAFGFLTGFNVCPPLLLAISYAFGLGSLGGLLLFAGFFAGTSAYLVLLLPLGFLGKWRTIRLIALMTAVLSGTFFLLMGVARILAL